MKMLRAIVLRAVLALIGTTGLPAFAATPPYEIHLPQANGLPSLDALETEFVRCFGAGDDPKAGGQIVLLKNTIKCEKTNDGDDASSAAQSSIADWLSPAACSERADRRILPSALIKELADKRYNAQIKQQTGIRILGAAFCSEEVTLSDLDLPYPLVLDYGFFPHGLVSNNLKITGHFSVDNAVIFNNFSMMHAVISDGLFARQAFMPYFTLQFAEIGKDVALDGSFIPLYVNILNSTVKRSVDSVATATSYFIILHSTVLDHEDISRSEARCAYELQKGPIGEVVAVGAGFGEASSNKYSWQRSLKDKHIKAFLEADILKKVTSAYDECGVPPSYDVPPKPTFVISDLQLASLCLVDFQWPRLSSANYNPETTLSMETTTFTNNLILDIGDEPAPPRENFNRRLELTEVEGPVFVFNFAKFPSSCHVVMDGFHFKRIYSWSEESSFGRHGWNWKVPEVHDVRHWLGKNESPSVQAYTTVATSFEDAGRDATPIRVDKAIAEHRKAVSDDAAALYNAWTAHRADIPVILLDYVRLGMNWTLGEIADYGFRPQKAIFVAIAVVAIAWALFVRWIGVVAFVPGKKEELRLIGLVFFFDHLIPALKINEDNYDVKTYLIKPGKDADRDSIQVFQHYGRALEFSPADHRQTRRADRALIVLKLIGFVLAAFVIAGIQALVGSH
jgi:hypothetical protein